MATATQVSAFISSIAPLIEKEGKKRGYKVVSVAIAQACIESAYGTSSLGYIYHNYFGMKCGSSWKGKSVNMKTKEEYTVGTLTSIRDNFRAYATREEGISGYYDFISTSRYANLKTATTAEQYAQNLKADGYATSSTYVNTLLKTVKTYGLTKYDTQTANVGKTANVCPYFEPTATLRKGSKGDGVRWVQWMLNNCGVGYNLKVDGDYGNVTAGAVADFQKRYGLTVNFAAGKQTCEKLKKLVNG
jgi:hypothetical protein